MLGVIKAKFEAGEDVNLFLSKGVYRLVDHDYLLNDWGIHHLHHNDQKKASGDYFNLRSGQLLFVHTTADHLYFIDIHPHNEHCVFAQKDLLRAVRNNWPDLNRKFLVREEEMEISPQFNEKDTVTMRHKGYYFFTQVNKHAYAPGLGSACIGFSMQAGLEMNEFHRHLYKIHCFVQENEDKLIRMLDRDPDKPLVSLRVRLIFDDWLFYVCERNSGHYLNLDLQDYQPFCPDIPSVDAEGDEAAINQASGHQS